MSQGKGRLFFHRTVFPLSPHNSVINMQITKGQLSGGKAFYFDFKWTSYAIMKNANDPELRAADGKQCSLQLRVRDPPLLRCGLFPEAFSSSVNTAEDAFHFPDSGILILINESVDVYKTVLDAERIF